MSGKNIVVRDMRRGFVYQTVPALNALRQRFDGRKEDDDKKLSLTTALAHYIVLTELGNENRSDEFRASQTEIAALAGSTRQTTNRYLGVFVEIGVLRMERVTTNNGAEESLYVLLDPAESSQTTGAKSSQMTARGVVSDDTDSNKKNTSSLRSDGVDGRGREGARTLYRATTDERHRAALVAVVKVADHKGCDDDWVAQSVLDACDKFPDRNIVDQAERFRFYWTEGNGENRPVKAPVATWRTWLKNAPTAKAGKLPKQKDPEKEARQARRRAARERLINSEQKEHEHVD